MTETLKVVGCAREAENSRALTLFFNRTPTDDEMRAVHNAARDFAALPELVEAAMWRPVREYPNTGVDVHLTDGKDVWVGSQKDGIKMPDGMPFDGHTFPCGPQGYHQHPRLFRPLPKPPEVKTP